MILGATEELKKIKITSGLTLAQNLILILLLTVNLNYKFIGLQACEGDSSC